MGTEFIKKQRSSARKYLDRRRADLCAPGLFKANPEIADRQFVAEAEAQADLHPGDHLQIENSGTGIILRAGGRIVGRNATPHPGLMRVVTEAGGFFPGAVRAVHKFSPIFEFCVTPASGAAERA